MSNKHATRRTFLKTASTGSLAAVGGFGFLADLPHAFAEDTELKPKLLQFNGHIEPLVRLIEESPRENLLEQIANRIRKGTSYREVLAAAPVGRRAQRPAKAVGRFKFHAVLVVNSAHFASRSGPDSDRWLPIFWALDYLKRKQIEEEKRNGWKMAAVDEAAVLQPARPSIVAAMDNWDSNAADAAVAGLTDASGASELFELFYRYGARDFRSIGHKAIFVANSWRTLACIGWQHAEPVLRSLAYALSNHHRR